MVPRFRRGTMSLASPRLPSAPSRSRLLQLVIVVVLLVVVAPFVVYAAPGIVGAQGSYIVLSGSMEPTISPGDVVIVNEADPATIEEGDIITYMRGENEVPTTHRVVGVVDTNGELAFETQGDALDQPDESPVHANNVIGEVTYVIPYIGYLIEFANTPLGFVALIVVPFGLLLAFELYSILSSVSVSTEDDPAEDGSHPPAEATTEETATTAEETAGKTIAITRTDLQLSIVLLGGFAIYAIWVVLHIQQSWSFAVTYGAVVAFILALGAYVLAGESDPDPAVGDTTSDD